MTVDAVVEIIRSKEYASSLVDFRLFCATDSHHRNPDGSYQVDAPWERAVPRICFAADYQKRKGVMQRVSYNGLLLLEIGSLPDIDEALSLRYAAGRLPQTLLTFLGADGRSVVIVCRAELPVDRRSQQQELPTTDEAITHFHQNAYALAQKFYTAQLTVSINPDAPCVDRICYVSADEAVYFNPESIPFYADAEPPVQPLGTYQRPSEEGSLPGQDRYRTQMLAVQTCLSQAFADSLSIDDQHEWITAVLTRHAHYCLESGIPKELALRLTLYHHEFGSERILANYIFDNTYTPQALRKALRKNPDTALLRHIPESTLLMLRTNAFMEQNYQFRKNVLTGVPQFRPVAWPYIDFRDVTEEDRNTMTRRALEAGLKSWDNDIRRYIESSDIPLYNPLDEYLGQLPEWDGTDRLADFARRVPTDDVLWLRFFPLWMRSMVAHWMGRDLLHGNALVPLLIGSQGCGKTTFCSIVLPEELRDYYNDYIDFTKKFDLLNTLSSFALVNIDEFDVITLSRQPQLKQLLSKPDVKLRVPYGKAITRRRRYASFIATTNSLQPLTDPTGSRRFLCVPINGRIDTLSPVDYPQLYAQLLAEVKSGERYWLTDDEAAELMLHNERFRQLDSIEEMVQSLFRCPELDESGSEMSTAEIVSRLRKRYPTVQANRSTFIKVGKVLSALGCDHRHANQGNMWKVVLIED